MLVIANGAPKSGSTWLRNIAQELRNFEPIPTEYLNPGWSTPTSIDPARLPEFLRSEDYRSVDILSKNHIHSSRLRDLLLSREDVYVLNLSRDLRDATTSHYHHFCREHSVAVSFRVYYQFVGRYKAIAIRSHSRVWSIDHPRVYNTSFEALKEDFERVVSEMAKFLSVELIADDLERIRTATSLARQREDWDESQESDNKRFFRKGAVGDYSNWMDPKSQRNLDEIITHGPRMSEYVVYWVLFPFRHAISRGIRKILALKPT